LEIRSSDAKGGKSAIKSSQAQTAGKTREHYPTLTVLLRAKSKYSISYFYFMNRLQHETSPYLLQHAHNPVDWYAWKPEAFEKAQKENKPILVSIGYSTCHWCHVMERESFEDPAIAAFMNEHFVNIKVDREERPDVDQIYMEACQVISGSGGWPLNCFLLPDGRPFYAGTYYPPRPAHNRPSWSQLLQHMVKVYKEEPQNVRAQAEQLTQIVDGSDTTFFPGSKLGLEKDSVFDQAAIHQIYAQLSQSFDREDGGLGGAPKFPASMSMEFILRYFFHTQEKEALQHIEFSLQKMIRGGIYDQLGGGFARYATDKAWLVPHFEKMLYDNALLIGLLSELYQLSGKTIYKTTIEECLGFIQNEMTHPEGGFYSALDADSEGVEGKYYVWDKKEIEDVLDDRALSEIFCTYYDVTEAGNWEGKNILWRPISMKALSEQFGQAEEKLAAQLEKAKALLLQARSQRQRPGLDDKILLNWNALQLIAYAKAYKALKNDAYKEAALKNYAFLKKALLQEDGLHFFHTYKDQQSQYHAFLDDYSYWIAALLELYSITFDLQFVREAQQYAELVMNDFFDASSKVFYYTSAQQTDIPLRRKELFDSSIPSGNSTMLHNLMQLGLILGNDQYISLSDEILANLKQAVVKYPTSFARWASALLEKAYPSYEVAIVGPDFRQKAEAFQSRYIPNTLLMAHETSDERYPVLAGRKTEKDTYIYVCRLYACQLPEQEVDNAIRQIVGQNA
jgi:uncharacterized protein YyaL (SSP411 family)